MKFKDLSIKRKITYLYLPFVILPILIFFFLSTNLYEQSIIDRSLISMEDNNVLVSDRLDDILSDAESAATYLTISINTLLNNQEFQGLLSDNIKFYNLISNELTYATLINENIDSIAFYDIDGRLYYTDHRLYKNSFKITDESMYQLLINTSGNNSWFDLDKRNYLVKSEGEAVTTLGKKIWNINTGKTIGYLFINISEASFRNVFGSQISDYYIYRNDQLLLSYRHRDSQVMSQDEIAAFLKADDTSQINNKRLISKAAINRVDWTLISQTNLNHLTTDFNDLLVLLSLMLIAIITLDIVVSSALSRLITDPIIKLKGGIEKISKGNFDYRFNVKTKDEIGLFAKSFNHMSEQIKELLKQVELEEEQKRTFEMALIQQQIKPHFLYNTLDIILKLSQMGQERKAQKVTKRLADYYKHSLSGGSDIVSVKKEIKITTDYLELQKIRYSDILDFDIALSSDLEDKVIPKLTLQPLVENGIYHGLKYKQHKGQIKIYDEQTEKGHFLVVEDNGVGITPEKLMTIRKHLSKDEFEYSNEINESFGLRNVHHRLKLFFGLSYGLEIHSQEQVGTCVKIKLPKEEKNDSSDDR